MIYSRFEKILQLFLLIKTCKTFWFFYGILSMFLNKKR
nr:MAG TPA: hypothetical protein [Caudoviricetes sp.]